MTLHTRTNNIRPRPICKLPSAWVGFHYIPRGHLLLLALDVRNFPDSDVPKTSAYKRLFMSVRLRVGIGRLVLYLHSPPAIPLLNFTLQRYNKFCILPNLPPPSCCRKMCGTLAQPQNMLYLCGVFRGSGFRCSPTRWKQRGFSSSGRAQRSQC